MFAAISNLVTSFFYLLHHYEIVYCAIKVSDSVSLKRQCLNFILIFCMHKLLYYEIIICMHRKTKELISLAIVQLICAFVLSKSNCRFHSLSHDATLKMLHVLKYVRTVTHMQLIFQYLHSNCGSVVFWVGAILIWPSLLCPVRLY